MKRFDEIIRQICSWIFKEDNIEKLLLLEPAASFEVLQLFFAPDISAILNTVPLFEKGQYIVNLK